MLQLSRSDTGAVLIQPRWPYRYVTIAEDAYNKLVVAQNLLREDGISLVVTRGLENEGRVRRTAHRAARLIGSLLFIVLFPARRAEVRDIFSPNGHDAGGKCIDVGIVYRGKRLRCLPFGVFTSKAAIAANYHKDYHTINAVWGALRVSGFTIHPNLTESLQIHCEC